MNGAARPPLQRRVRPASLADSPLPLCCPPWLLSFYPRPWLHGFIFVLFFARRSLPPAFISVAVLAFLLLLYGLISPRPIFAAAALSACADSSSGRSSRRDVPALSPRRHGSVTKWSFAAAILWLLCWRLSRCGGLTAKFSGAANDNGRGMRNALRGLRSNPLLDPLGVATTLSTNPATIV